MTCCKTKQCNVVVVWVYGRRFLSQSRASASAELSPCSPPSNFVRGQVLTMWDIVCTSSQSQRSLLDRLHLLWQALQCPWSVQKRLSIDHWRRGRSKPGSWIAGSLTKKLLTTYAVCQSSRHRVALHQLPVAITQSSNHKALVMF